LLREAGVRKAKDEEIGTYKSLEEYV